MHKLRESVELPGPGGLDGGPPGGGPEAGASPGPDDGGPVPGVYCLGAAAVEEYSTQIKVTKIPGHKTT